MTSSGCEESNKTARKPFFPPTSLMPGSYKCGTQPRMAAHGGIEEKRKISLLYQTGRVPQLASDGTSSWRGHHKGTLGRPHQNPRRESIPYGAPRQSMSGHIDMQVVIRPWKAMWPSWPCLCQLTHATDHAASTRVSRLDKYNRIIKAMNQPPSTGEWVLKACQEVDQIVQGKWLGKKCIKAANQSKYWC